MSAVNTLDELLAFDQPKVGGLFGMNSTPPGVFGGLNKADAAQALAKVTTNVVRPIEMNAMQRSALLGGSLGLTAASVIGLVKMMRNNAAPPKNTYTLSPEIKIYDPVRPAPKRRAPVKKQANSPMDPTAALVAQDPYASTKTILALAAGVPAGFWLGNKITRTMGSIARHRELQAARADYERALRESSEVPAVGRGLKMASDPQMARLAQNCRELVNDPGMLKIANGLGDYIPDSIKPYAMAALVGLPLMGGYYGFTSRWDQRKQPALEYAERRVNAERELTNPTYPLASLEERPENEHDRLIAARQSMDDLLSDNDFDYIR